MRRPRLRFSIRTMIIAVAVIGLAVWAFTQYPSESLSYAEGRREAERELQQGNATLYTGGLRRNPTVIDAETGLPYKSMFGCMVSSGDLERMAGHNDAIMQYIRRGGVPRNSLKPWEAELFHLKRCFEDQAATAIQRLVNGGTAVTSPDGRYSVRLVASPSQHAEVEVTEGHAVLGSSIVPFGKKGVDLLWQPNGAPFAVVRSVADQLESYSAFDLKTGRELRAENWCNREPTESSFFTANDY